MRKNIMNEETKKAFGFGTTTCVQCKEEMPYGTDMEGKNVPVCLNEKCANFGLLALSLETISKYLNK